VQGPRAELARALVTTDAGQAVVRTGPVTVLSPATVATAAAPANAKPDTATARKYQVQRGETLSSIGRKFQCDTGELARNNGIKPPRYALRPGQELSLEGCKAGS
jgi:membrane-bound lytic murein transglycosylase D